MEILGLLMGTLLLRPYVFVFLFLYLLAGSWQIGWRRIAAWTLIGYCLAFLAEYSSVHWGVPFGDYFYIDATRDRELWIAGVPFMDSLSFSFLTYTGFSCAWQIVAARKARCLKDGHGDWDGYRRIRRSPAVVVLGALITTLMDMIIDPVALMGDRWFLGQIYGYRHPGAYFGIPVSNFVGWALLAAAIIGVNQFVDSRLAEDPPSTRSAGVPFAHLAGFALFIFVVGFNLAVALWLKAYLLFCTGTTLAAAFLLFSHWALARVGFLRTHALRSPSDGQGKLFAPGVSAEKY